MFDAQAWVAGDFMMNMLELPIATEKRTDIKKWLDRNNSLENSLDHVDFQADYIKDLLSISDYPHFNVDKVAEMFKEWLKDKKDHILTYQDKTHQSVVTGTMAAQHHTEWMDELDDSKERYLHEEEEEIFEEI